MDDLSKNNLSADVVNGLDDALAEVLPGYMTLDRDLILEHGLTASLVGLDGEGRLLLVMESARMISLEGDDLVLVALDALAWALAHRGLLARHVGGEAIDIDAPPRIVLVCDEIRPAVLRRLGALPSSCIQLFERRELCTSGARSTYLLPVGPKEPELRELSSAAPAKGFLGGLDDEERRLAELLLRRIDRLDETLECTGGESGIRWLLAGDEICDIATGPDGLIGTVPGEEIDMVLSGELDVDQFVEAMIVRYLSMGQGLGEAGSPLLQAT